MLIKTEDAITIRVTERGRYKAISRTWICICREITTTFHFLLMVFCFQAVEKSETGSAIYLIFLFFLCCHFETNTFSWFFKFESRLNVNYYVISFWINNREVRSPLPYFTFWIFFTMLSTIPTYSSKILCLLAFLFPAFLSFSFIVFFFLA